MTYLLITLRFRCTIRALMSHGLSRAVANQVQATGGEQNQLAIIAAYDRLAKDGSDCQ